MINDSSSRSSVLRETPSQYTPVLMMNKACGRGHPASPASDENDCFVVEEVRTA